MTSHADSDVPSVDEAVRRSGEWMHFCVDAINANRFARMTARTSVAASLYHLSVSHQASIHVLAAHDLYGSAFALIRPQVECFERGLWLHKGATEAQLAAFFDGKKAPSKGSMLKALGDAGREIDDIISPAWSYLCDYTHGGAIQIRARIREGDIGERFAPEHVASMLIASCTAQLLVMAQLAELSEDSTEFATRSLRSFLRIVRPDNTPSSVNGTD